VIAGRVPRGSVHKALYWDTPDPYHYVRIYSDLSEPTEVPGGWDQLLIGGEDRQPGPRDDALERFGRLEAWARRRFPMLDTVEQRWSGIVYEPNDGLAFIGRNPGDADNVYIATGDSGHGMTHGTIAGMLVSDLILGRPSRWRGLYDPARINLKADALVEYLRIGAHVAAHYADWLRAGDVPDPARIPPGEGAVVRRDVTPTAVYRNPDGTSIERSAVCTHLGGVVHWNSTEQRWECPCHGSRFARDGSVLNGPATAPLAPARTRVMTPVD
jgi:nitrite reductase/ring-hydroxylating ferredoxin subunit